MTHEHEPQPPRARLWREPLVHFALLGLAIFGVDRALATRADDPTVIQIGPALDAEVSEIFRSAQGRDPTPSELEVLRERWIDNEVLYREGIALRLEQGDRALRERVIFKALNVIESNVRVPTASDTELRAYFDAHRDSYDVPARFDFSEAVIHGGADAARAGAFADALNTGKQADIESGLRVFEARPEATIVDAFGAAFARGLASAPLATWVVLESSAGPRVVRVDSRSEGARADFDSVRSAVRQDWVDQKAQALRTAAVRELGKKYTVKRSGADS